MNSHTELNNVLLDLQIVLRRDLVATGKNGFPYFVVKKSDSPTSRHLASLPGF